MFAVAFKGEPGLAARRAAKFVSIARRDKKGWREHHVHTIAQEAKHLLTQSLLTASFRQHQPAS